MTEEENIFESIDSSELETENQQPENVETLNQAAFSRPSIDDLDDTPQSQRFRKINSADKLPDVLTIESVELGVALTKDLITGEVIAPEKNDKGRCYYKSKLILKFKEEVNGERIKELVPSVFYGMDDNGNVSKVPSIPQACDDAKLDDNFTSEVAKLRNMFCKLVKQRPQDVSSKAFVNGLVGKTVKVQKKTGTFKGRDWAKLKIISIN